MSENSNKPISDAVILNTSSKSKTSTDDKGEYILSIFSNASQNDTIQISHLGFIAKKITLKELKKQKYKVGLFEEIENLNELTLTANHQLKLKSKLTVEKLAPIKYGISSFGSFVLDGKIYISGGDASTKYDINKRMRYLNVSEQDYLKRLMQEQRSDFSTYLYNDKFQVYDIKNNIWQISDVKFKKRGYHNLKLL